MMQMTLNGTVEFEISHYNRYTDIRDGKVTASANFGLNDISAYDSLVALNGSTITSVKIEKDDTAIYNLTNQHAHLSRISENIYDGGVNIDVSLVFNDEEGIEE